MEMAGEQQVAAPKQKVWEALNDPDILRESIPGCESLEQEADDRFTATVEVKVGPISARFNGSVSLTDLNPPESYTLILEGNGGMAGTVKGSARVQLSDADGGTLVTWNVDAQVGGRLAQLGGPIIDATAKRLAGKFFARLGEIVSGTAQPGEPAAGTAEAGASPAGPAPTGAPSPARPAGFPIAWILAIVVAALAGFLLGRGPDATGASAWAGVAIGLLLILVAGAAFEYGRRTAAPVVVLDNALLRRLTEGERR